MNADDPIRRLAEQIRDLLPAGAPLPPGFQDDLQLVVQSLLARSDLVTREEFDAQSAVLRRTREKLETLERELETLEARLAATDASGA
ncbi:MAG: accessory factor UbiK family protein [Pseudomonadales bacterium]|jgi:BMFP domain-containing protein YqiC|nr:accessory factor UbiK family protein [Pseudomonadales bacterium]